MEETEHQFAAGLRAKRMLKGWSHADLAEASEVAPSVILDVELGVRGPTPEAKAALLDALTRDGEPSVLPLPATIDGGQPLRWVDAANITEWGRTRRGQDTLPELISRLIRAEYSADARLRFPSGDSVAQQGWDGQSFVDRGTEFVPAGGAGWELGAGRKPAKSKADEDWNARSGDDALPASDMLGDRGEITFLIVTAHRWRDKDSWAAARRAEGRWKDVRVIDADDLVHWVERHPAVGQWLAVAVGKRPPDLQSLDEVWDEWALATDTPLTAELSITGRDKQAAAVVRWLRDPPAVFSLQADSAAEAASFLHAAIAVLPSPVRDALMSRAVAPQTENAARQVATAITPLILVLRNAEPGLAARLARSGHHVFVAVGPDAKAGAATTLSRPTRWGLFHALRNAGVPDAQAERLARDAGRSLTTLRRQMQPAPGRSPAWATGVPSRALIASLLAGGWIDDNPADKGILSQLFGGPYDDFARAIAPYLDALDGPLRKIDNVWRLKSPRDAWGLLASVLTDADVRDVLGAAETVLTRIDPTFELPPEDRWLAPVRGVKPEFSGPLVAGLADTLILLSLLGESAPAATAVRAQTERAIGEWLSRATGPQWWSMAPVLPKLAEAAPDAFLAATRTAMTGDAPAIGVLFETEDARGHIQSRHIHLIWALERLAWDPERLRDTAHALAGLTRLDPGGRNVTRPQEQLVRIFLAWSPQTNADSIQRCRVLDELRRTHPKVAWEVMNGAVPIEGGVLFGGSRVQWREQGVDQRGPIEPEAVEADVEALAARLTEDVGCDVERWETLLNTMERLQSPSRRAIGEVLLRVEARITDAPARDRLRTALRKCLARHGDAQGTFWAIPLEDLVDFRRVFEALQPIDPLWRHAWLFSPGTGSFRPGRDWKTEQTEAEVARVAAITDIAREHGLDGLRTLRAAAARPDWLAEAILDTDAARGWREALIDEGLHADDERSWGLAEGLLRGLLHREGRTALMPWIERAHGDSRGTVRLLLLLRSRPDVWTLAAQAGRDVEAAYWREVGVFSMAGGALDVETAVDKLLAVRRIRGAAALVERYTSDGVAPDLVFKVLQAGVNPKIEAEVEVEEFGLPRGDVIAGLFAYVAGLPDVDRGKLMALEWAYFQALQHTAYPALGLRAAIATDPDAFIEILKLAYVPSPESGVVEPPLDKKLERHAAQAWHVLDDCRPIPGCDDAGEIDAAVLMKWTVAMRARASDIGRQTSADNWPGRTLANAQRLPDVPWPPIGIAAVLDATDSVPLHEAFYIGALHNRGVTMRMPSDGGGQERALAARYRADAEALAASYPVTAALMRKVSEGYLDHANREDKQAEHHAWSS